MAKGRPRKLSTKIIVVCVVFTTILSLVISWLGYDTYSKNVLQRYQVYVDSLVKISAGNMNGDEMRLAIDTLQKSEAFLKTQNALNNIKENSEVNYVYMVYFPNSQNPRQMSYVLNAYTQKELREEEATLHSLGDPCGAGEFDDNMMTLFYDALYTNSDKTQTRFVNNNTSEFGYIMTAYRPVVDSRGKGVCILAMDISMNQIHENQRSYVITVAMGTLILLVVFLLVFITIIKRSVITPIKRIAESAQNFVKQSYETPDPAKLAFREIAVGTRDEIELLASSLNHMTSEIKAYMINLKSMSAEKERISAELDIANQIQANMFPTVFPAFPNRPEFDIYALKTSDRGGDGNFYDFFLVDESHLCIAIGKASGQGIPAMLFAVLAAANIRSFARLGYQPYRIVLETNNQLSQNNTEGLTVSAFIGIIDLKTGEMAYINAGQPATLVKRAGTGFEEMIEVKSFVLANMENVNFRQNHLSLMQGDILMLYTSGVSETKNKYGDEFSEAYVSLQLNEIVKNEYKLDKILAAMNKSLDEFKKDAGDNAGGVMLMFRFFG